MIVDFNKKFYTHNKDIVMLNRINAIREAINNTLLLNELDIPMSNAGCNIESYQLKSLNHPEANEMVTEIEEQIKLIEYVNDVEIKFYYKSTTKKMKILVMVDDLDEELELNISLIDLQL